MNSETDLNLENFITDHQQKWSVIISELNKKLRSIDDLISLQELIYSRRQDALDYYFDLLNKISGLSKDYKVKYAKQYNFHKTGNQIRYSSESSIINQIASDLHDEVYIIELLSNHCKYMQETIKTIDNIIYAINNRIKIEELIKNTQR